MSHRQFIYFAQFHLILVHCTCVNLNYLCFIIWKQYISLAILKSTCVCFDACTGLFICIYTVLYNTSNVAFSLTLPFFSFAVIISNPSQYGWITTKAAPWLVTFMTSLTFSSTLHPGVMTLTMPGHHLPSI